MVCGSSLISKVVTISDYSRSSIPNLVGDLRSEVIVCYPPIKPQMPTIAPVIKGFNPQLEPFVLVLNAGRPEKNAASVVRVFDRLFSDGNSSVALPEGLRVVLVQCLLRPWR